MFNNIIIIKSKFNPKFNNRRNNDMCAKKVKVKKIKNKKKIIKVRVVSSIEDIEESFKAIRENLEAIQNEPKMDFSGIRRADEI